MFGKFRKEFSEALNEYSEIKENNRIKVIESLITSGILVGGSVGGLELTRHLVNTAEPYLRTEECIPIGIFGSSPSVSCRELEKPVLVSLEKARNEQLFTGIMSTITYNTLLLVLNSGRYFCAGTYALGKILQNQYKNK